MTLKALTMALLEMTGAHQGSALYERVVEVAPIIMQEARDLVEPLVVGAIIARESMFNSSAVGSRGEIGLMQIKPDALAATVCRDLTLFLAEPWANIRCGVRILRRAARRCSGLIEHALSAYNGRSCGPSRYSRKVLALLPRKVALRELSAVK